MCIISGRYSYKVESPFGNEVKTPTRIPCDTTCISYNVTVVTEHESKVTVNTWYDVTSLTWKAVQPFSLVNVIITKKSLFGDCLACPLNIKVFDEIANVYKTKNFTVDIRNATIAEVTRHIVSTAQTEKYAVLSKR